MFYLLSSANRSPESGSDQQLWVLLESEVTSHSTSRQLQQKHESLIMLLFALTSQSAVSHISQIVQMIEFLQERMNCHHIFELISLYSIMFFFFFLIHNTFLSKLNVLMLQWEQLAHLVRATHTLIADWEMHVRAWPESINRGCVTAPVFTVRGISEQIEKKQAFYSVFDLSEASHLCNRGNFFLRFFSIH